ncbi:MAG: hypothetical protein WBA74_04640, partial [Cyclobacteriaceae bacterium]
MNHLILPKILMNRSLTFLLVCLLLLPFTTDAQKRKKKTKELTPVIELTDSLFHGLKWRNIGPYRGGRSVASTGVIGQPHTYYMG